MALIVFRNPRRLRRLFEFRRELPFAIAQVYTEWIGIQLASLSGVSTLATKQKHTPLSVLITALSSQVSGSRHPIARIYLTANAGSPSASHHLRRTAAKDTFLLSWELWLLALTAGSLCNKFHTLGTITSPDRQCSRGLQAATTSNHKVDVLTDKSGGSAMKSMESTRH